MAGPRGSSAPRLGALARSPLAVLAACALIALASAATVRSLAMVPESRDLACPSLPRAGFSTAGGSDLTDPAPRPTFRAVRLQIGSDCRMRQAAVDTAVARYESRALGAMTAGVVALLIGGCWWWAHALGRALAVGSVGFFGASLLLWSLYL